LPVRLVWVADFPTHDQAFSFGRQLKGWSRAKKEAAIRGEWDALPGLARGKLKNIQGTLVEAFTFHGSTGQHGGK
jgi:hypothetical protein